MADEDAQAHVAGFGTLDVLPLAHAAAGIDRPAFDDNRIRRVRAVLFCLFEHIGGDVGEMICFGVFCHMANVVFPD